MNKTTNNSLIFAGGLFLALLLGGCSFKAGYNSTYLPPEGVIAKVDEPILIVMTKDEQEWVYSGHPTSFTGGATTLTIPLGNITKQIALEVFSRRFKSAELAHELPADSEFRLALNPRIKHFEYAYNQLKNLGFAITPEVQLDLTVKLLNSAGKHAFEKTYSSGLRSGSSYMISGSPHEKINATIHKTLFELMELAAKDTEGYLSRLPTTE